MTPPGASSPAAALAAAGVLAVVASLGAVGAGGVGTPHVASGGERPSAEVRGEHTSPQADDDRGARAGPRAQRGARVGGGGFGGVGDLAAPPMLGRLTGRPASVASSSARWRWPLRVRTPVVRPFVAPVSTWAAGHRGLDLATSAGAGVLAVELGRVTHAAVIAGRGTVSVQHHDGLVSTYEPVRATVAVGDLLAVGDVLGVLEPGTSSHCGHRACLHLGARRGNGYVDPWPLLARGELALLPLR